MLVEWIIDFVLGLFRGLFEAVLPVASDLGIPSTSGWLRGYAVLNHFLPLDTALLGAGLILGALVIVFGWKLFETIWRNVPKPTILGTGVGR